MTLTVVFTPEAEEQLVELYRYIASAGSADVAVRYSQDIVAFCEELAAFRIGAERATT
ncbi:type II toxin-antitoxin system RelE/ParE family toxin [Mycobacterium sp. GA-1841]|uniref:type II toxin-antitoxin system RelE/ParE family toxin n=1 Tax=Mycobacterium sp. GA-1841 TaxID=1834154 RepID=UPI001C378EE2|nr:type II toxin-antitoxin system RelE/ParE family toxin [Mycobacterium sp. GA-1841]